MSIGFVGRTLFPLGTLCGVALAVVAAISLAAPTEQLTLKVAAASAGISVFTAGYFRRGHGTLPGLLCLQHHLLRASPSRMLMGFGLLSVTISPRVSGDCSP